MNKKIHSLALLVNLGIYGVAQAQEPTDTPVSHDDTIVVTAAEQNLQAPGVSTITADEIRKNPVARDVSEIIRTMPGVNLTGNSTSGQRGNNRQIDIRGMGPENTLILIDGKPVSSRNSVRQGWRGERDTRGDTSWVPPEMIERIEVLRGPAAARYGNGAAGGVVRQLRVMATARRAAWLTSLPKKAVVSGTARGTLISMRQNIKRKVPPNALTLASPVRWATNSASACMATSTKLRLTRGISTRAISPRVPERMPRRYQPGAKG